MEYRLYCEDVPVAAFEYAQGTISAFHPERPELLPMQIKDASADAFTLWLGERAIDLNTFAHRELMRQLLGSRDRIAVSIATHMFSITDTFTCFPAEEFIPRNELWSKDTQDAVSDFILISSDTSLRLRSTVTPNASTDGSFPKTWHYEAGEWWLYKLQSVDASKSETAISQALRACGWDAAEYVYDEANPSYIKTRNFIGAGEFFEPYDSLRYLFKDRSDADQVIYQNFCTLNKTSKTAYRRILMADALFMNSDRHMRNFGVIRSSKTGEILRMAPNFDNNQAYKANKAIPYSPAMLRLFREEMGFTEQDREDLRALLDACGKIPYLADALEAGRAFLSS